jgi:nucleoside-diphosphate-sugar epimerase
MSDPIAKTVLMTGANGYIGNAVARSFVRAGWKTYGLVRNTALIDDLAADEVIPLHGSPGDQAFVSTLPPNLTFGVIVSTAEQIMNYVPHYNEIISLLTVLARKRLEKGLAKSLVPFTSGCKHYGMMDLLAESPGLKPHTEESPISAPSVAVGRATNAARILEHRDLFDAAVLRPTNVYGLSSSWYGDFFRLAKEGQEKGNLELNEHPKTILHAMHVDDCGDAYVELANDQLRSKVAGECFNISSYRFETLEEIAGALAEEYGIQEIKWGPVPEGRPDIVFERGMFLFYCTLVVDSADESLALTGFSQWTGSDKLRKLTGFCDQRQLFSKGLKQYRLAYEVAIAKGPHTRIQKKAVEIKKGGV